MRRFRFRLEEFLRIRRHHERTWELRLAEATGHCIRLEGRLRELREEKAANVSCSSGGILYDLPALHARGAYILRLDQEMEETRRKLDAAYREREKVNQEYLTASRNRKVLEKLKERKADEYYKAQLREEGKTLDEVGASLAARSSRAGDKG